MNSCGKKRILYRRDRFIVLIGAQKKVLSLNNQSVKRSEFIAPFPLIGQKQITWVCIWKQGSQHTLPLNLTEPEWAEVQDKRVPPLWYNATLFHCLSNSSVSRYILRRKEALTDCRCTHITQLSRNDWEVMLRSPSPMPINNQDTYRDERQVP